jgi:hypothetical protein
MASVRPASSVASQRLGDETVLVHLRTNAVYTLNETGARMWELLGEGLDRDAMLRQLEQEFDVSEEQLVREVDELLSELTREGLVEAD